MTQAGLCGAPLISGQCLSREHRCRRGTSHRQGSITTPLPSVRQGVGGVSSHVGASQQTLVSSFTFPRRPVFQEHADGTGVDSAGGILRLALFTCLHCPEASCMLRDIHTCRRAGRSRGGINKKRERSKKKM